MGPTYQVLSESCCCSYASTDIINTEVVSSTDGKKKKKSLSQFTLKFDKHLSILVAMGAEAALAHLTLALAFLSCQCNCPWPHADPEEGLKISTLWSEYF